MPSRTLRLQLATRSRMNLFYLPDFDLEATSIAFNKEESRHMSKVLRLREGQEIHLTDGKGLMVQARISHVDPKHTEATVVSRNLNPPLSPHLHIAIAPTKMNDRYEWFLEKSTELGINRITPIICEHSERKVIKQERMQKILVSAMKQSLQAHLPRLDPPIRFSDFLNELPETEQKFVAHCHEGEKILVNNAFASEQSALIMIGPEGDFSENEVLKCIELGFIPLSLGTQRLRTETAGIATTAAFRFVNPV